MANALLAASFIDEARLREHLNRNLGGAEGDIEARLTRACNRAIGWMEARTTRKLRARNYRTQVTTTTSGSTAEGAVTINVASTAALEVGDDMLGAGLDVGTRIQSISSATALVPSKKTVATIADGSTLTFGSGPLALDVEDNDEGVLYVPESPMLAANLYAMYFVGDDNVRQAISLSYLRFEESTGMIRLLGNMGRFSDGRYEFECRAGYEQPSATALGHPAEWEALSAIQLRVAEVYFTDDLQMRGRANTVTVGGMSLSGSEKMPADIEEALLPFWRRTP